MVIPLKSRQSWIVFILTVIAAGILSRLIHTGIPLFDKYLGDALYAVMMYGFLHLAWPLTPTRATAARAMILMTAIELFQLTRIPAHMLASQHAVVRLCARLLGVEFSFLDLFAYAVGISCVYLLETLPEST